MSKLTLHPKRCDCDSSCFGKGLGIFRAVIPVTHGATASEAAPMGLAEGLEAPELDWLPSSNGFRDVRQLLRELAGLYAGA